MPTILYAEDDRSLREAYAKALRDAGFTVTEAKDGEEAWESAQTTSFDVVLTDLDMPRLSGTFLTQRLRKDARYKNTPIFILSGNEPAPGVTEGLGVTAWLHKSIDADELISHLRRFCPTTD